MGFGVENELFPLSVVLISSSEVSCLEQFCTGWKQRGVESGCNEAVKESQGCELIGYQVEIGCTLSH